MIVDRRPGTSPFENLRLGDWFMSNGHILYIKFGTNLAIPYPFGRSGDQAVLGDKIQVQMVRVEVHVVENTLPANLAESCQNGRDSEGLT